jgi:hypothetical protein
VISQLDHQCAAEVEDIISPEERDHYTTLKTEWVTASRPSFSDTQTCQTTSSATSGPAGYSPNVRVILAGQPEGDLDAADRIIEAAPQPALESVAPRQHRTSAGIEDLSCQVAALSTELTPPSLQLQGSPP